nr:MAG TPA: hypothetical protein [Caudoviricetes sp.]
MPNLSKYFHSLFLSSQHCETYRQLIYIWAF